MCHTRHEYQLEKQFIRKYFLMCPKNESDFAHTISWYLIVKRSLKTFGSPSKSTDEKGKKEKKESQLQSFFHYAQMRKIYKYLEKVSYLIC